MMIEHEENTAQPAPFDPRWLYPDFRQRLQSIESQMESEGFPVRVVEGFRSFLRSELLYNQGRTIPGKIVTQAKPGQSFHNYGMAVDYCFHGPDPYSDHHPWALLGKVALASGCRWGGTFSHPDRPHVEADYLVPLSEIHSLYADGSGVVAVWAKLDVIRSVPVGTDWDGDVFHYRLS